MRKNIGENMKKYSDDEILQEFKNFTNDKFSMIISTTSIDNIPLTNYSPFIENNGKYYISVSSMMPHFENMINTKKAHVLIIEDEKDAAHIYARKRLYFEVSCKLIEEKEEDILKLFDGRYGDKLSFLRTMKDFKILELTPKIKNLVLGFGGAYQLDIEGKLIHKDIAHK